MARRQEPLVLLLPLLSALRMINHDHLIWSVSRDVLPILVFLFARLQCFVSSLFTPPLDLNFLVYFFPVNFTSMTFSVNHGHGCCGNIV